MSSMQKNEERDFIRECIRLYAKLPSLWNTKSKEYHNRDKKNLQYDILLRKYQERFPSAGKIELLKKFNSLRTNFRKELRHVEDAKKKGDTNATPTLWYFDEFLFLLNPEKSPPSLDDNDMKQLYTITNQSPEKTARMRPANIQESKFNPKRSKIEHSDEYGRIISSISSYRPNQSILDTNMSISSTPQNEYEKISSFWAIELQKMEPRQQLFAKKAINDILFEGQLGNLHRNSIEINRMGLDSNSETIVQSNNNNTILPYEPNIVYEDQSNLHASERRNFKFEIEHVDPIEFDTTILGEHSGESNNEEDENQNIETTSDQDVDTEQLTENNVCSYSEEEGEEEIDEINDHFISKVQNSEGEDENNHRNAVTNQALEKPDCPTSDDETNDKNKKKDTSVMCSYCSKILHNKHSLKCHEELHKETRERKVVCPKCGIKYYNKRSLYTHMRIHQENRQKNYKCEFCGNTYYHRGVLNVHRRLHLGQMIQCTLCPRQFYRQIDLDRHMPRHSVSTDVKLKSYKYDVYCKYCNKNVTSKHWKAHKAAHLNEPLLKCTICEKDFFSRRSCIRHVRLVHKIQDFENFLMYYEPKTVVRRSLLLYKQQENIVRRT